ncbi:interaptin-like [Ahaetulla prasina]|uniref:interaptin-like n=1 Tax=Ahaetulla prasina TaxID=499056 RepID=UPI0026481ED3|nr:interaptin-like [Ahaetulla prasina]
MEQELGRESKNEIVQAENIMPKGPDEQPDNNTVEDINEQAEEIIHLQGPNEQTEENENQGPDEPLSDSPTQKLTEQEEENQPQELRKLSEENQLQKLSEEVEESQLQELSEQGEESQLQELREQVEESQLQELSEQGEESQLQELREQGEERQLQELSEQGEESQLQELIEQGEESQLQELSEQDEERQLQELSEQGEESQLQELSEQSEERQLQELSEPDEEGKRSDISDLDESSKLQDLTEQVRDIEPPAFTYFPEEQIRIPDDKPATPSFIDYLPISFPGRLDEQGGPVALESKFDITQFEKRDSKIQDIKRSKVFSDITKEKEPYQFETSSLKPRRKSAAKSESSTPIPKTYYQHTKPLVPRITLPQTSDKAIQCNKMLMRRLTPLRKPAPPKVVIPKTITQTKDKDTQITTSFETLLRKPLASVEKKKKESKTKTAPKVSSNKAASKTRRSPSRRKSTSSSGSQVSRSTPAKKSRKPNVVYNVHITVYDRGREINTPFIKDTTWEDCIVCSGLSRICTVFNVLKCGRVPVSKLLFVLHTLKILVTRDEMYCALQLMNVDVLGTVNFSDFLEVVNKTSPFSQSEGFQNTLWAFKKIKKDMVCVDDLRLILENLEVNLTCETMHDALKCTRINKNRLLNFREFLLAVKELQKRPDEEVFPSEYALLERKPFQDVTGLVGADSRWRRKYQSYFDTDISDSTTPYFSGQSSSAAYSDFADLHRKVSCSLDQSFFKDAQSDEDKKITIVKILQSDIADQKEPCTISSVDHDEGNTKESDNMEMKKSTTDIAVIEGTSAEHDLMEEKKSIHDTPDQNIPPEQNIPPDQNITPDQNIIPDQNITPDQNIIPDQNISSADNAEGKDKERDILEEIS